LIPRLLRGYLLISNFQNAILFPCQLRLLLFFDKLIGRAVIVAFHLVVVVDVDPGLLPFGIFMGNRKK